MTSKGKNDTWRIKGTDNKPVNGTISFLRKLKSGIIVYIEIHNPKNPKDDGLGCEIIWSGKRLPKWVKDDFPNYFYSDQPNPGDEQWEDNEEED